MFKNQRYITISVSVILILCLMTIAKLSYSAVDKSSNESTQTQKQSNESGLSSQQPTSGDGSATDQQGSYPPEGNEEVTAESVPKTYSQQSQLGDNKTTTTSSSSNNGSQNQTSPTTERLPPTTSINGPRSVSPRKISCNVYVLPGSQTGDETFQLMITSKSGFTARVSIVWANATETITLDVVDGSASATVSGKQLAPPDIFVYALPDTSTQVCSSVNP